MIIDDFNHYACFSEELDKNFEYGLLTFSNIPPTPNSEESWKIVRVICCKCSFIINNTILHDIMFKPYKVKV